MEHRTRYRNAEAAESREDWAHYSAASYPGIARRMELLNELAVLNDLEPSLTHPRLERSSQVWEAVRRFKEEVEQVRREEDAPEFQVASFDIDLTLSVPDDEDYNGYGVIDPGELSDLQEEGWIVGTCSDRDPRDQRAVMAQVGVEPDFCIPKEMLDWARQLLPGSDLQHIGDDARRDRGIAEASGWQHRWPAEWQRMRDQTKS